MLHRQRWAMVAAAGFFVLASVLLVAMAFPGGRSSVQVFDDAVRDFVQENRWRPLRAVALAFNWAGAWYVSFPLRIGVLAWLWSKRRWEAAVAWVVANVAAEIMIGTLKAAYARPRPPDPRVAVTAFSFPSGHAVIGAVIAIGLVVVLVPAGPRRRYLEVLAGCFVFLMAASRIYVDAHWLSDVVAGVALGAAVMIGCAAAVHEAGDLVRKRRAIRAASRPPEVTSLRR